MPPRPFPFPLNIGIDIIHVKRIRDIWLRGEGKPSHSHRFLRRFLTPGEVLEFQTRFGHVSTHRGAELDVVCRHLAGRCVPRCRRPIRPSLLLPTFLAQSKLTLA